ncbi:MULTISPECIES: hypothetical protein [Lysobacteraceae]|uniref:hypothetical protein n=1 Tax=Lysobacteraceae TaxID=32033 RepID=UPI001BD02DEA|nr:MULTISPECIES: hypothetical protein [Lysobacter]
MSRLRTCAAGLLLAVLASPAARAAEPAANHATASPAVAYQLDEIIRDTQRSSASPQKIDLVWWLPAEFWMAATAADKKVADSEKQAIIELFREYTVVGVVVGDMGTIGVQKFRSEAEVRADLHLVDPAGREYTALPPDQVDKQLALMLQILKPMLASVVGEMGNNLNFYVFPGKAKDGKRTADPLAEGKLVVKLFDETYPFRLPLGSVLPARFDPATGERFPGSYRFNPFTGAQLNTRAAPSGSQ